MIRGVIWDKKKVSASLSASYAIKTLNLVQLNDSGCALTHIRKMEVIITSLNNIPTPKCLQRKTVRNIRY